MSTTRASLGRALWLVPCLAALACSLESRAKEAWSVEPPRLARPALARSAPLEYLLAPESAVDLVLSRRGASLRGEVPLASGRLWLDPADLGATRATLTFDLAAIQLWDAGSQQPRDGAASATLTEQSLDWLQLARAAGLQTRPELRYARFTLLAIGSHSSNDLHAAPTVRSGPSAVVARRVRLRASGELELHGHRLPQTVALAATFEWDTPPETGAPPARVVLETTEPLGIDPLGYDIVPRNARGELLAGDLAELRRLPRAAVQVRARWRAERVRGEETGGTDRALLGARAP